LLQTPMTSVTTICNPWQKFFALKFHKH